MQEFKKKEIYNECLIRIEKEKKKKKIARTSGPETPTLTFYEYDVAGLPWRQSGAAVSDIAG